MNGIVEKSLIGTEQEDPFLIIFVGLGAVATTLMGGVHMHRDHGRPLQGTWSYSSHETKLLGLPSLKTFKFCAFDRFNCNAWNQMQEKRVFNQGDLELVKDALTSIEAKIGVTEESIAKDGVEASIENLRNQLRIMIDENSAGRAVLLLSLSTEKTKSTSNALAAANSIEDIVITEGVTPTLCYVIAALKEGIPVANLTPNVVSQLKFVRTLAIRKGVPMAGDDLKTGQTFLKTVLAPSLVDRRLTIKGWYSTNMIGNSDGLTLSDPDAFHTKEKTKKNVLENILGANQTVSPYHVVRIDYYPPRGDHKESWDCIDIEGWCGYEMSIRLNFLCRDSILAAPLALDVAVLLDAAKRSGHAGIVNWLAPYFKAPICADGATAPNAFPLQMAMLREGVKILGERLGNRKAT